MNRTSIDRDYNTVNHPLIKILSRIRFNARKKMYLLFSELVNPKETNSVLDVGVTPDDTQQESNFFELFYPYKYNITATSVEDCTSIEGTYEGLTFVQTKPGEAFPFDDSEFDILFCNAVIEHVGSREQQQLFLNECLRVSKKFFITTPNRWYPIEMHTAIPLLHWLPQGVFRKILRVVGHQFLSDEANLNLLTKFELSKLVETSSHRLSIHTFEIKTIKTFLWPSNLILFGRKG